MGILLTKNNLTGCSKVCNWSGWLSARLHIHIGRLIVFAYTPVRPNGLERSKALRLEGADFGHPSPSHTEGTLSHRQVCILGCVNTVAHSTEYNVILDTSILLYTVNMKELVWRLLENAHLTTCNRSFRKINRVIIYLECIWLFVVRMLCTIPSFS